MKRRKRRICQRPQTRCRWWKGFLTTTYTKCTNLNTIKNANFSILKTNYTILDYRWVDGESFPGQNKGYSHPTEVQMTENERGSESGKKDEDSSSKTKTTFFYSDPSRLPSSHPYPSSALPDHHLVCSVSLLSFASYSHRSRNLLRIFYRRNTSKLLFFTPDHVYALSSYSAFLLFLPPRLWKRKTRYCKKADSLPSVVSNFICNNFLLLKKG